MTLLLRLEGPLQAWGYAPALDHRPTAPYPTKSGVVGLLAAALGRSREEGVEDLVGLRMGVRLDAPGTLVADAQYAGGVPSGKGSGLRNRFGVRHYLADAAFLVGLEGEKDLLLSLHGALADPFYPLYLGRRGCLPSPPVYLPDGLLPLPLEEALAAYPPLRGRGKERVRVVLEASPGEGFYLPDLPLGKLWERRFALRPVREEWWAWRGEDGDAHGEDRLPFPVTL